MSVTQHPFVPVLGFKNASGLSPEKVLETINGPMGCTCKLKLLGCTDNSATTRTIMSLYMSLIARWCDVCLIVRRILRKMA